MSLRKLILWDLDETLISADGAGERAFERAAKIVFGVDLSLSEIDYTGQTDPVIGLLIRRHFGLPEDDDAALQGFLAEFLRFLPEELPRGHPRILPGVEQLTTMAVENPSTAQGLLTGNLSAGAEIKLNYFGLWERFPFGAFAEDAHERDRLGPIALRRASVHHEANLLSDETIVIGDTVRDVACAHAFGARSLAVASGKATVGELLTAGADCAVESLEDAMALEFIEFST